MLKGLALTPPVVGRISIGRIVERGGKRLPEKDDEFTLTTQVQTREGWMLHPLDEQLRRAQAGDKTKDRANGKAGTTAETKAHTRARTTAEAEVPLARVKLRSIPVRLLFDDPDLNLRASYCLFDRNTGRPQCVGDGQTCRRATVTGMQTLECRAPEACELADRGCKPFGRLNVHIGDEEELSSFVFRTTGFNSIRTLATRLKYFQAVSGGNLSTLPLELRLRGKSTQQSHGTPIHYVDLTIRTGSNLKEAIFEAKSEALAKEEAGFSQAELDGAAREGLSLGAFEESPEEGTALVEEFYPTPWSEPGAAEVQALYPDTSPSERLRNKLERKAAAHISTPS
ncbi:MAG: recombination directionality factor [Hydrogenophaga sp.]|uniref:recombination directionality factor n=1 Tax=Hydrogenophaga sp. TaxID=1904254 RepID=UPI004036EA3D